MQTFLLVSLNPAFLEKEIVKIKKTLQISPFEVHEISPAPTISIAEIRRIQKILSRKPFEGKDRLIIVHDFEKATPEAAHAFLKILEEPPPRNSVILTTNQLQSLLPTILSRCQIISEENQVLTQDKEKKRETEEIIKKILQSSPGERILLSLELAKSKEEVLHLLDMFLSTLEQALHEEKNALNLTVKEITTIIQKTAGAKAYLRQNVNYKATLDIFFLGFPLLEKTQKLVSKSLLN